jgi:hypothetical protein
MSKLKDRVTVTTVSGKERSFNQVGAQEMIDKVGRASATVNQDLGLSQRWLRMRPKEISNLLDEKDKDYLGHIALPQSEIMQAQVSAYMRKVDDVIIDAIGGTSYSGELGTTANTLSGAQLVAVDFKGAGVTPANVGLNLAKIIAAKSVLGKNEVDDDEEFIFLYTQQQLDDLLNNVTQVNSSDYNSVKALVDGTLNRFMGFTWIKTQRLPLATDIRTCYAYVKSAVKFAENARQTHVDILPTQSHAIQIRSVADMGAVRMEEKKVVAIACDEAP